ncbi:MAG: RNA-protein complex protein Nop10 [Candidatus Asgardarchaeia archaeon]|nr:MAG: RNA-protein complex protein Nop10 [Candidatus Asgardarchaeum californiense]
MGGKLRKCPSCGMYTLRKDICPYCGNKVTVPYPPKFSPEDKYIEYRIKMKKERGIL